MEVLSLGLLIKSKKSLLQRHSGKKTYSLVISNLFTQHSLKLCNSSSSPVVFFHSYIFYNVEANTKP